MEDLWRWETMGRGWDRPLPGPGLEDRQRRRLRAEQVRGEMEERGGRQGRGGRRQGRLHQAAEQK